MYFMHLKREWGLWEVVEYDDDIIVSYLCAKNTRDIIPKITMEEKEVYCPLGRFWNEINIVLLVYGK